MEGSMPAKKYIVELTTEEEGQAEGITRKGKSSARRVKRAHILLLANKGKTDREIAGALSVGSATVGRTRKKFVEGGLEYALSERSRPGAQPKLDGRQVALLTAIACSDPPEGQKVWSMQLLADRLVELGEVDSISHDTVGRVLKKTTPNPG
jgi:transposase